MTDDSRSTPGTFVQLGPTKSPRSLAPLGSRAWHDDKAIAPDTALILAAVLLAAAEQVSDRKLAALGVMDREDLTLLQLAMAFRADDTGLEGDVFEWSLLLAINAGDPGVMQLMADALALSNVVVEQPQAVLVAAEPGRLVAFSPELPAGASLATGKSGRPPHIANLLQSATSTSSKADLLLGPGERWVTASLKSNPRDLKASMRAAMATQHAPRIGITASHRPGLHRDSDTNAVMVHVPVHGGAMMLAKLVLTDVKKAFDRHLTTPATPLRQDASNIGWQLSRWESRTVREVVNVLRDRAKLGSHLDPIYAAPLSSTGASVADAVGALIAVNPLRKEHNWSLPEIDDVLHARRAMKLGAFELLD